MSECHLVTGATGFVGGALALELVASTDAELFCLVRSNERAGAHERLAAALRHAAEVYEVEELVEPALERCHAVEGDITSPRCGVSAGDVPSVSHVWHAAASLAYEEDNLEEIERHNVIGTRAVTELATAAGAETFNYFSTAYVAGRREGAIEEQLPTSLDALNNAYEQSKVHAELLVAEAPFARIRILRPSIVIGHGRTHGATTFTGLYGFVRHLRKLNREVTDKLGPFLSLRSVRFRADPTAPLNFIPVDTLVRNAVRVGTSDSDARVFHLTNATPPTVRDVLDAIFESLGLRTPRYVDSPRQFTSIDTEVDDRLEFYRSYLGSHKFFDRSNADAVTGAEAAEDPLSPTRLTAFVDWYLAHLEKRPPRQVVTQPA